MVGPLPNLDAEYSLSDKQFGWVCDQVKNRTGINLTESKRSLVYNRLASRLRLLGLENFDDYFSLVEDDGDEVEQFVNALTTNVTSFFREPHHFEFLEQTVLPEAIERNRGSQKLRIWSAGCSLGMEPYSISMVLEEFLAAHKGWDAKILATDLDTQVLKVGSEGIYKESDTTGISNERKRQFVLRGKGEQEGFIRMRKELRSRISFRHLNLMQPWPMSGPFDVIFCRNVVIYFDRETQANLWNRYAQLLHPGGYLIVGHSESVNSPANFESAGRTIYRRGGGA